MVMVKSANNKATKFTREIMLTVFALIIILSFFITMLLPAFKNSNAEKSQADRVAAGAYFAINGNETFYFYLKKSETLYAKFSGKKKVNSAVKFVLYGPNNYTKELTIPANNSGSVIFDNIPAETGENGHVWKIVSSATIPADNDLQVYTYDMKVLNGGVEQKGRIYTNYMAYEQYGQHWDNLRDFSHYITRRDGYRYKVTYRGYNGVDSYISYGAVGATTTRDSCISSMKSGYDGNLSPWRSAEKNGELNSFWNYNRCEKDEDLYKIWLSDPAQGDLPETATLYDGTTTTLYQENPKQARISDMNFKSENKDYSGVLTANVSDYFERNIKLVVSESSGKWSREIAATNYDGKITANFDGKDDKNKNIPAGTEISFKLSLDKPGIMHITLSDVESLEGGIEFERLNGSYNNRKNIYWDHSAISEEAPERCGTYDISPLRVPLDGKGVDSNGGVAKWSGNRGSSCANSIGDDALMDFYTWDNGATAATATINFLIPPPRKVTLKCTDQNKIVATQQVEDGKTATAFAGNACGEIPHTPPYPCSDTNKQPFDFASKITADTALCSDIKDAKISYEFISGTENIALPEEIKKLTPNEKPTKYGANITPENPNQTSVDSKDFAENPREIGTWTFQPYTDQTENLTSNATFRFNSDGKTFTVDQDEEKIIGVWNFEPRKSNIRYEYFCQINETTNQPEILQKLIPENATISYGEKISPIAPSQTEIKVDGGTCVFKDYDCKDRIVANDEETCTGTWEFTPDPEPDPEPGPKPKDSPKTPNTASFWLNTVSAAAIFLTGIAVAIMVLRLSKKR